MKVPNACGGFLEQSDVSENHPVPQRISGLAGPDQIPGTAQFQIFSGNLKPVIGLAEGFQPLRFF